MLKATYNSIDSNAVRDNLFTVRNGQLYDVPNRSRSPYRQHTIYMAAADQQHNATGEVTFVLPPQLAINNDVFSRPIWSSIGFTTLTVTSDNQVQHLGRDFFSRPFTFRYSTPGLKQVKLSFSPDRFSPPIEMAFYIQVDKAYSAVARVGTGGRNEGDENIAQTQRYQNQDLRIFIMPPSAGMHSGCTLQIRLSQNNQLIHPQESVALRKPLIIAEGFDPYKRGSWLFDLPLTKNANLDKFLDIDVFGGIGLATTDGYDLNNQLDSADYDLIYIDYIDGTDDITRNAKLFQEVLRWVNARKVDIVAGRREQNVVLGLSMGGLVARYGLAEMEKNRRAGVAGNNHEVRMIITHDSPHRGANFPLAYQSLVETYRSVIWAGKLVPSLLTEVSEFLTAKANNQMLIYQTVPIGSLAAGNILYQKNTWIENTYSPMVTFPNNAPAPYQFIALSNGSECGTRLAPPFTNLFTHEFSAFASPVPWLIKPKITTGIKMKGLPDRKAQEIYRFGSTFTVSYFGGLIELTQNIMNVRGNSTTDMLPIDGIAGGTKDREIPLPEGFPAIDYTTPDLLWFAGFSIFSDVKDNYTFIPKYSALDIRPDVPVNELIASTFHSTQTPSRSQANLFFTSPSNSSSAVTTGHEFNQNHILFTNRNANFIFSQLEPIRAAAIANTVPLPILDCSSTCNPNTLQIQSTLPSLCFGAAMSNVFSINNLPTPAVVNWTVDNDLVTLATPNSPTTIITPRLANSRGWVTITANITSAICNGFGQAINRRIWVGEMTQISRINSNARYDDCLTFQETYSLPANQAQGSQTIRWFITRDGGTASEILSAANRRQCSVSINVVPGSCEQVLISVTADNGCSNSSFSEDFEYCLEAGRPRCTPTTGGRLSMLTLSLFPNPSSGKITLTFENLWQKVVNLSVINSLGTQVMNIPNPIVSPLDTKHYSTLDLSTLPDGLYLVTAMLDNGTTITQKVILQKGVIAN